MLVETLSVEEGNIAAKDAGASEGEDATVDNSDNEGDEGEVEGDSEQSSEDEAGSNTSAVKSTVSSVPGENTSNYDPAKREPEYANARASPVYELLVLTSHYHPTVKKWACGLLQRPSPEYIVYSGMSKCRNARL
jgi:ribosome biogenesis protein MAK21